METSYIIQDLIVTEREKTSPEKSSLNRFFTTTNGTLYECTSDDADVKYWDISEFVYYSVRNLRFSKRIILNKLGTYYFAEIKNGKVILNATV